jgi:hypothetical protein
MNGTICQYPKSRSNKTRISIQPSEKPPLQLSSNRLYRLTAFEQKARSDQHQTPCDELLRHLLRLGSSPLRQGERSRRLRLLAQTRRKVQRPIATFLQRFLIFGCVKAIRKTTEAPIATGKARIAKITCSVRLKNGNQEIFVCDLAPQVGTAIIF